MPKPTPAWMQALQRRLALWNRRRLRRRHLARQRPYADWCAEHDRPTPEQFATWQAAVQALGDESQADLLLVANAPDAAELLPTLQAQHHGRWRLRVAFTAQADGERARWRALAATEPRVVLGTADAPDRAAAIATLLRETTAPWCALLDASERWREHTLLALLGRCTPDASLVYGDEDRQDAAGPRHDPWFKPRFDLDALLALDSLGAPALCAEARRFTPRPRTSAGVHLKDRRETLTTEGRSGRKARPSRQTRPISDGVGTRRAPPLQAAQWRLVRE